MNYMFRFNTKSSCLWGKREKRKGTEKREFEESKGKKGGVLVV